MRFLDKIWCCEDLTILTGSPFTYVTRISFTKEFCLSIFVNGLVLFDVSALTFKAGIACFGVAVSSKARELRGQNIRDGRDRPNGVDRFQESVEPSANATGP